MDEGNIGGTFMFFLDYKHWKWWTLWTKETLVELLCSFWTTSIGNGGHYGVRKNESDLYILFGLQAPNYGQYGQRKNERDFYILFGLQAPSCGKFRLERNMNGHVSIYVDNIHSTLKTI
jgi:hypothetical protein